MQNRGEEQSLVSQDNGLSISDTEGRGVLEEELSWARLERQKVLALSAEADEAIWHLAALARRTMQERDEARNQARMLLAGFQARNAQTMMLPVTSCSRSRVAGPGAFAATGYGQSQALAPAAFGPPGNAAMQGHYARAGAGCCVASSSTGFGHTSLASPLDAYAAHPALHGFASSSQDHFDPDMFLVDAAELPQDAVPAAAGSSQERGSGAYGQIAEPKPLQWKGKSAGQDAVLRVRGAAGHGHAP
ncbi:hypothetical protein PVAP13_9NG694400 [Panicum virgatum]|uniref:Uncharacterized protein n=1 Tax=Panicum virgatum TaxID=38727 RepID=A0A8T0N3I7_PANVG|nr:hypothetical protein PVAP13_9NG694400 [Panicum virgatum]